MKQLYLLASISVADGPEPVPLSTFDAKAKELVARMTLDEKIGQMTQPDQMFFKDPVRYRNLFSRLGSQRRRFGPQSRQ